MQSQHVVSKVLQWALKSGTPHSQDFSATRVGWGDCGGGLHPPGRSPTPLVGEHAQPWVTVHVSAYARVFMCLWRSMHSQP